MSTNKGISSKVRYNGHELLSRNSLWNMVLGERGNGKTYFFKKWCIQSFKKTGHQFVWLRRYKTELKDMDTFFTDIAKEFPDDKFSLEGSKFLINGKVMGYLMALTQQVTKKGVSYENVDKLIFDEVLIEKGNYHYLTNEVHTLMNLWNTICRARDVRVFLISNSVSEINPYFSYFKIRIRGHFTKVKEDFILEYCDTEEYREAVKQTRFGRFISDTEYGSYAINNEFIVDNHEFIEKKSNKSKNTFNVKIGKVIFGVWIDMSIGKMFISPKNNPKLITYCFYTDDMQPNYLMLNGRSANIKLLKNALENGCLYYENFETKAKFIPIYQFLGVK